jgi:GNAT superfamily N-acetyltransferase
MTTVSIRRTRPDEGPAFRAIRLEAIRESPTAFGSTLAETAARPLEYWQDRVRRGATGSESVLFAAVDGERWIGVVGGFVDDSTDARSVDLVSMWVHPEHRGQGVGRRLVEQVVAWAKERSARRVVLWLTEGNDRAVTLYRRSGFRETGETQPHPSRPDLAERRMVMELDSQEAIL